MRTTAKYLIIGTVVFAILSIITVPVAERINSTYTTNEIQAMGVVANAFLSSALVVGYLMSVKVASQQETLMQAGYTAILEEVHSSGSDTYSERGHEITIPAYSITLINKGEGLAQNIFIKFIPDYDRQATDVDIRPKKSPLPRKEGGAKSSISKGGVLESGHSEEFRAPVEFEYDSGDGPISLKNTLKELNGDVDSLEVGFEISFENLAEEEGKLHPRGRRIPTDESVSFSNVMEHGRPIRSEELPSNS
ncbi:hypothetical protein [Halobacterium wangiae]|uniref:hypothetical protein n=1 Tax=Halobacterium wangiae TaxID=2902623 RepID=UPI001E3C9AB3|nr:hypothetical protein [Halobacterium wangiae]